jgi:hypothetical protein
MSIEALTRSILAKMQGINKWQREFFIQLICCWLALRGRYNFKNMGRQMSLSTFSLRNWFSKSWDFKAFNTHLIQTYTGLERIWVFDPCFLSKAGRQTYGLGYFWSGCEKRAGTYWSGYGGCA